MRRRCQTSKGDEPQKQKFKRWLTAVCDEILSGYGVLSTLEFDRNRKSMSVICKEKTKTDKKGTANRKNGGNSSGTENYLLAKGAPEFILERCTHILTPDGMEIPLTKSMRDDILKRQQSMASIALRCLALAIKSGPNLAFCRVTTAVIRTQGIRF